MTKRTKKSHVTVETSGEGAWHEVALPYREQSGPWPFITHLSTQESQPQGIDTWNLPDPLFGAVKTDTES